MKPFFTGIEEFSKMIVGADRHAHPKENFEQKEVDPACGHFIKNEKPDIFLDLDDRGDIPSLNTKAGSSLMGTDPASADHDLFDEIQAMIDSLSEMWNVIKRDNERHIKAGHKERCIDIEKFAGLGNHTQFIKRLNAKHHSTKKLISIDTVKRAYEAHGFAVADFLQPIIIAGISCRHYIPGENMASLAPDRHFGRAGMSTISSHKHRSSVRTMTRDDGIRQTNIVTPCMKHPSLLSNGEESGLTIIRNARNGQFRYEFVGMEEILQDYRDILMSQRKSAA